MTDQGGPINLRAETAIRIAGLTVDPAGLRLLADDGREAALQPRVMQVLIALLRAKPGTLSRDDLIALCWDGRIVSDDAIERAVGQLRKTLQDIGVEQLRIETITSIGYRVRVAGVDVEGPAQASASPEGRRDRSVSLVGLAVVGLLALLGAAAIVLTFTAREARHTPSVELPGFAVIGAGVDEDVPMRLREELRSAFGVENAVAVKERGGDYRLQGSIQRIGDELRFTTQLVHIPDGATAWTTTSEQPITSKAAARHVAITWAQAVRCGLTGAGEHQGQLPAHTLALFLSLCESSQHSGGASRSLDLSRQITAQTPSFARGWSARAIDAGVAFFFASTEPERAALRQEADQAASHALQIDPKNAEAWTAKAGLLLRDQLVEKEAMRLRALAARPSDCGCEHEYYGHFLMDVGRTAEAVGQFHRAYDMRPTAPSAVYGLASSLYTAGRGDETEALRGELDAYSGERKLSNGLVCYGAMRGGRWAEAGQLLDPEDRSQRGLAFAEAFSALDAGEAGRIRVAGETLAKIGRASPAPDPLVTRMLAVLGDRTDALEALERQVAANRLSPPPILFDPLMASLWEEPRYVALLEKAGLFTYWRQSGTQPDACRAPQPPGYCRVLAQSSVRR